MLADCEKCWNTPCSCGWDYKDYDEDRIVILFENIMKYHDRKNIVAKLNRNSCLKQHQ